MSNNTLRYDQMIEEALRGVVRRSLRQVAKEGLPGSHHFFITFKTRAEGVDLSDYLKEKYPEEMTIVLQYQFWNLEVWADRFTVTLSFNDVPERLEIPFAAVSAFADPPAKFGLQFQHTTGAAPEEVPDAPEPAAEAPATAEEEPAPEKKAEGGSKVVALDTFRRK